MRILVKALTLASVAFIASTAFAQDYDVVS